MKITKYKCKAHLNNLTKFQLPSKIVHSPKLKLNIALNVHNNHKRRELTSGGEVTPLKSLGELNIVLGLGGGGGGW